MDPMTASALIGAGSKLAGGLMGMFDNSASEASDQDWKRQKKVLQNSIQWRVADAKKAGVSPLYALGAPTMSYSPTSVGGDSGLANMGRTLADMGQDVSRAVAATQSPEERALQALTLRKAQLENDYLSAQINSINTRTAQQIGPPMPSTAAPKKFVGPDGAFDWTVDPRFTPAQEWQNQYGDFGENIMGTWAMASDAANNVRRWISQLWRDVNLNAGRMSGPSFGRGGRATSRFTR